MQMEAVWIAVLLIALGVAGQPDAHSYTCSTTVAKMMAALDRNGSHPFHHSFIEGGYTTARLLADWVTAVVGEEIGPLFFAYYANTVDSKVPCTKARSGTYVNGGGPLLCDMLEWQAGTLQKELGLFFVGALDLGCASRGAGCKFSDPVADWMALAPQVKQFGYAAYEGFTSLWPEGYVYTPRKTLYTVQGLAQAVSQGLPYWGMSGGGGSGAGFEVFCVDAN
eukprot:Sspe_Gene.56425::Locus_31040_Transcript_1_1_Confidence_1.000_Length_711::g.56425::m.56425